MLEKLKSNLKFPKERKYPIALATLLMYLAWHPLGDFIESLIIGWRIVPMELFTINFWKWWVPFAQAWQQSYTIAFFGFFIHITILAYLIFFIFKKYKKFELNKYLKIILLIFVLVFLIIPFFYSQFSPEHSVAYQNDIEGFKAHKMKPLNAWMYFHMAFWCVWMLFPHILGLFTSEKKMLKIAGAVWVVFLIVWLSSIFLGKFIYVPINP